MSETANFPEGFYGVPLVGVTEKADTITLSSSAPAALSEKYIVSYPAVQAAQGSPTADVLSVYDVTAGKELAEGTDYILAMTGTKPLTVSWEITRVSSSADSADGDTARVTYRYGTVPDESYSSGEFQGEPGAAPMGTAFEASDQATTGSTAAGIGEEAAGGSLTDPAMGRQSSSETGAPGSEYAVTQSEPGPFGWSTGAPGQSGSPDTEAVYGGSTVPESYKAQDTSYTGTLDTTDGGGSDLVPSMYEAPPGYRPPSSGVAASVKDTTLTDILGNEINASPLPTGEAYAASDIDTLYIGAPAAPTVPLAQEDSFSAAQAGTPYYLTRQGVQPSTITVADATASKALAEGTDYAVTTAGNGATTAAYVELTAGTGFAAGDDVTVSYSYGDATYWDSNPPASVPAAPVITGAAAVSRGAQITWEAPEGTVPVDYYLVESADLGTMYVPATGQPVDYGQPAPSGGAQTGQPSYQADALTLGASPVPLTKQGILNAPNQVIVRDLTSAEGDPAQPDGQVLEYGYDYTVAETGVGPWVSYEISLAAGSVNAKEGDSIVAEYWYGADPDAVSAVFTQGLVENVPVIYKPDGTVYEQQGYSFRVAAGNRAGLGPYSAPSAYVVPLNLNEAQPGSEGSVTVGTGSLDPANTINPIYLPDGSVKPGTGLGG